MAFDVETTGLSPLIHKIIELSAIKITPDDITYFDTLINPQEEIPQETIDIHGITNDDVKDAPLFKEVLPKVLDFIGDASLLAHNAKFDAGFLVFSMHQEKCPLPKNSIYCSIRISRALFPDSPGHKLSQVSEYLKIPLTNHHHALDDAYAGLRILSKSLADSDNENKMKRVLNQARLFQLSDFDLKALDNMPSHLKGLPRFCENKQIITIKYKGGSHRGKFRPIRPVSLLPMPEGNILYAHCLLSDLYKSFSLKKISQVKEAQAKEIQNFLSDLQEFKRSQQAENKNHDR